MILLTPFIFYTDLYFPFITAKAYYFRVLVEIGFFAWLGLAVLNPAYRPKKSFLLGALGIFMVVVLVANIQGANPAYSFWSNYERMEGYITFLHLAAFFFVVTGVMQTKRLWEYFLNTAVAVGVAQVGWAALQVSGVLAVGMSADRIDGTLGNATYLAIYMVFTFFIALLLLVRHEGSRMVKYWYAAAMALSTLGVFWTATRGSLLGLLGGVVLSVVLMSIFDRKRKVLRNATIGVFVFIFVFGILVTGFKESALVQNVNALKRIASISLTETTTVARFYNWNTAWQGVKERPLLGYGLGNYGPVFDKYYNPKMWNQEQWFDRVHNIVFDWLIAAGFLGLLSYASLFVALMYYIWRKAGPFTNHERAVLTGLIAAYCFHNLFVFDNLVSYIYFFIILAYVHTRVAKPCAGLEKQMSLSNATPIVVVLMVICLPYVVWATNAPSYNENRSLIEAIRIADIRELPKIESSFAHALSYNTFGDNETRQQLVIFAGRILGVASADAEQKQSFLMLAASEMQKEITIRPNDPKFLLLAGQLLGQTENLEEAKSFFEKATSLSPNKQVLYQPLVEVLFRKGDSENALALAERVYAIEPLNDSSWRQYARSALRAEKRELYDSILNEAFETGRADRVIGMVEQSVASNPKDVQLHASLALAYYRAGMLEKAIVKFKEVGDVFPEAKAQADGVIKKIEAGEPIL